MRKTEIEPDFELRDFLPERVVRELGYRKARIGFDLISKDMERIRGCQQ